MVEREQETEEVVMEGGSKNQVVKTGFRKQLTQKELEEKRAKGLCFYCDQKYTPGHNVLENYTLLRSLWMRRIRRTKRLPCQLSVTTHLRVDVANGSKMVSSSEYKTFKWTLQGNEYEANCMILPLEGCDMVLGIQWLSTLGDINYNFKNLTVKFNYQGKKIVLRGSQKGSLQWIQGKKVITEGQWKQAQLASMIVCVYPT
nr:retroviral aspartyl protease [Tanacetum cinerariifolium]